MGQTLYTFNGGGTSGDWDAAYSWTTDPTGSTSINSRVPNSNDNVVITNSFVVFVKNPVAATGLNVTVQKGGMLDLTTATNPLPTLTSLGGQGTLRIAGPYFPTVTTNNFDDANTGTVEYYDWPAVVSTLPTAGGQYNNLRLLNTKSTAYEVQVNSSLTLAGNLTLTRTNGAAVTLNLGRTAGRNRNLSVGGILTVGVGTNLGVTAVSGNHQLTLYGSFINNGTVRLHNGNVTGDDSQDALLVFFGATDANLACNGPTDLSRLYVDKGVDSQTLLNVTSTVNPMNSFGNLRLNYLGDSRLLILVNGVAKLGNNVYLTKIHNGSFAGAGAGTGYYELGSSTTSPTLWVAGATVLNNSALAFVIYGTLRVSAGNLQSVTSDAMVLREDGQILIEGGTTTVDKFRPSSTSSSHRGSFIMTGGTFEANGAFPGAASTSTARFSIPYLTQSFRMTGGTIRVQNPSNATGAFHLGINPNNAVVTGGTIEVILPNTNTNASILSTAPLWNLTIKKPVLSGGTTSKAILDNIASEYTTGATNNAQALTVLNNFVIDGTSNPTTFDANSQDVNIQGSFIIGNGSTYLPTTNTTTFSGGQNQLLTNNGSINTSQNTFYNWVVNKSAGTLTLAGTADPYTVAAAGKLSLLNGVLSDGGKTINVLGGLVNSAAHTSGGGTGSITMAGAGGQTIDGDGTGVFGNLNINSTAATQGSVAVTLLANMSVANTLNFASNHLLALGANRLSLTNVSTSTAIMADNGFSNLCFVQTTGNQSDLGLQKTYGGADNFVFPVGTGSKYAPATVQLQLATSLAKYGQVSVSPVAMRSPFVTSTNALAYYWKVRSTGFGTIPSSAINMIFRMSSADVTGSQPAYIPARYLPVAWTPYNDVTLVGNSSPNANISFNNLNQFEGEFTAGEPSAFGTVTAYYSRASGSWETPGTWSTGSPTGPVATVAPAANNPVFIGAATTTPYSLHTVTVTANGAKAGSLVIDRGSVMDVGVTTGHNFGALPDAKVGGSGRLRVSSSTATVTFPGGDFGSFLQPGGGTVDYYTTGTQDFTLPTVSGTLTLNQYRNLWLNAASGRTIILPNQNLRVYAQLKAGVATTYPGTVLLSATAAGDIRADSLLAVQAGVLRYANATARALTADTDVRVDAGATFDANGAGAAVTNALTVGGSLTNNGTVDFKIGNGTTGLTFTGSTNASLTGSTGTLTNLYALTLNKGTGRAATLSVDVAGTLTTPTTGWLTLTNGTLRFAKANGTLTIHDAASPYLITDNAGLKVDGSNATVTVATNTSTASDLKLAGQLDVLQGTLNVGTTGGGGNDLEYASAGAPTVNVSGGTLYVNGQVRRTTANTNGSLRYDQRGGAVEIGGLGATAYQSNERGLFEVQGVGSIFRMSSGTLTLRRSNQNPTIMADLYLAPDSTVVTGGTVVLGNAAAGVGNVSISVNSTVPLYDLKVEAGSTNNTNTGRLTGANALTLKGSLTIANDFSYFNANGRGLNLDQNLVNNNSSTSTALTAGGFQPGTAAQTTTFTGKGPALQQLTSTAANLTVFGGLIVNNAQTNGTLQLGRNALVAGTLTLTKGTMDDNGNTITALGDVLNSAVHSSTGSGSITLGGSTNQSIGGNGLGKFGNLTLDNATGATTTTNQEITKTLALNNGVLFIGSNLLNLSNPAATAVTTTATFDNAHCIRTNGIVADLGVRKSYPAGAANFTFPIGAAVVTKYTPVQMNMTSSSAAGTITVQPIDIPHPSTTDPAAKELSYYWKVSSTGLTVPVVTQVFAYAATDVNGTETNYKLGRFLNGQWTPALTGITTSVVNATAHTLTNTGATYIDGDYTGGEISEFGTVPTFYSRTSTAGLAAGAVWTNASAWTDNSNGSDPLPTFSSLPTLANPVVILPGHLITSGSAGRGAASLLLNGTLDLGTNLANNFSTVSGTGTLRIGSAIFPAGNYANFVAVNTGTVDFTGAVQLPARDTYNNLTFSGANTKQLTNLDLILNGALSVAANTTVDNPTSQNIILNSATAGATVTGTFNLNDGKLTTAAFVATTATDSKLTLGAGAVSVGTSLANAGTVTHGNGTVTVGTTFTNTGTYNANAGTGDITIGTNFSNSATYNAGAGSLNVSGNLTNAAGASFATSTGAVNTTGNFSNAGTYGGFVNPDAPYIMRVNGNFGNLAGGQFNAQFSNIILRGNFSNAAGTGFVAGNSLVQFISDLNRTITGTTTFYDLQKLGTNPLGLGTSTNVTVSDLLTLQSSTITTGTANTLFLTNSAMQPIIGNSLTAYVAGRLAISLPNAAASIRTFPVGAGSRYRPVTIKPVGVSSSPVVLVEIINGAPAGTVDGTLSNLSANRYYRINLLSGSINQPTVQLSFNTDVTDEEVNVPGNLRVAKSTGPSGPWSTAGGSGVYSPDAPKGYTTSAATTFDNNSFFALASTNKVDNPLTGSAPLPVELVQFNALRQGSAVNVAWATASEKNSAYFVVQRSAKGDSFTDLGRVAAQGSTTSRHEYTLLDKAPLAGTSYYRLRQVDNDGTVVYSPVAVVHFDSKGEIPTLVAYPNPATASGFTLAATNLGSTSATVQLFDNVGRLVLTQAIAAGTPEATIQPAHPLATGMYFVVWNTADGVKLTTKVSVE